jgi:hypothetical protein
VSLAGLAGLRAETGTDLTEALRAVVEAITISRRLAGNTPMDAMAGLTGTVREVSTRLAVVLEEAGPRA